MFEGEVQVDVPVSPSTPSASTQPESTADRIFDTSAPTSPSRFEQVICTNPPILDSLFAQITTDDALHIFQTSRYLRDSLKALPTAWRYISLRLYQPATVPTPAQIANNPASKQQGSYSLDRILINIINPFSRCLQSLELDNTAVSGGTLTQTVLVLRRETLQHLSVRGCKNVSLKYHINPWLQMHVLAKEGGGSSGTYPYDKLALKSLYTYRCRHHRRRPYLPSSLARKESDSEPTHELVKTCHALGIWTDTAWCTTPGSRCFRRRGYVTMRSPQDPREVWVVYDRLWRSKNWLGAADSTASAQTPASRLRRPDARFWIANEEADRGEPTGIAGEGKDVPMHLRSSHRRFVENITCTNCSEPILERCEQCSVIMHCSGCRKTLCASCAFDRPYLRNKQAPESERDKFWWAPGCAVSPCSMQDHDGPMPNAITSLPTLRFKWCCTEPVFSGGGGITYPSGSTRDAEALRAAPLPRGEGWEDSDFEDARPSANKTETKLPLAGRWSSVTDFLVQNSDKEQALTPFNPVPRVLCDDCHALDTWKVNCKGCALSLCVKHDMRDRLKVRICGLRDLAHEAREFSANVKRLDRITDQMKLTPTFFQSNNQLNPNSSVPEHIMTYLRMRRNVGGPSRAFLPSFMIGTSTEAQPAIAPESPAREIAAAPIIEPETPARPQSRGSNYTDAASRSSSPGPSASPAPATPEPKSAKKKNSKMDMISPLSPPWKGCYSFYCPAIRPAGDHRRRCVSVVRQCHDCKINVCGDCVAGLEANCPCKGCQPPPADENAGLASMETTFYCQNCRWTRMANGKCRKYTDAFLEARATQRGKKIKQKGKSKPRKPLEARRASNSSATPDDAAELLGEFSQMRLAEHSTEEVASEPAPSQEEQGEIQEIEDVGHLARELITRIQTLRGQFRPGSLAALALPDVRLIDEAQSLILNQMPGPDANSNGGPSTQNRDEA
jgi:hypothetical protein